MAQLERSFLRNLFPEIDKVQDEMNCQKLLARILLRL